MALSGITAAASNGMQMATHKLASAAANIAQGQLDPKDILDVRTAEGAFTANASSNSLVITVAMPGTSGATAAASSTRIHGRLLGSSVIS